MPRFNPILDQLATYPQQALNQQKAKVRAAGIPMYDFGVGDPNESVPDFILTALKNAVVPKSSYPSVMGPQSLRDAVVDYVGRRFGVELNADQHILPVSGTKEAVFHLPQLIIDPNADDRTVIFPDPGYPVCYRGALFAGGNPVAIPLEGDYIFRPWELDDALLKDCRLMWINSPHNPSGAVMSLDDLQRTADVCRKYDIVLVSDECYADLYTSDPPHSILECGLENVLALHSLSKRSGMTGYRSGFVAGDPNLIARFKSYRANPGLVPQDFVNAAATVAWADDDHTAERRAIFSAKKTILQRCFEQLGLQLLGQEASIYLWIQLPDGWDADAVASGLLEHGVVVSPGRFFARTEAGKGYIRLAMVPDIEACKRATMICTDCFSTWFANPNLVLKATR